MSGRRRCSPNREKVVAQHSSWTFERFHPHHGPALPAADAEVGQLPPFSTETRRPGSDQDVLPTTAGEPPAALPFLAEYRPHTPGTPLSSCDPRSSNVRSDPTINSLTVWETRTSDGAASAATRAPMLTASPPILSPILSTSPVWSPARTSIPRGRTASVIAMAQRTARAGPSNEAKKPSPAVSISIPR